jgi:ribosome biogenesis protein SSF1/2
MARRRKNRTHLKGPATPSAANAVKDGIPKSFIIKHGQVGSSLTQLVRDMRKVMEPNTASRLKVSIPFEFHRVSIEEADWK